jgi:dephospho-CoA kinase
MKIIGLTGGIASGKSTVARMLAERGARVVDADLLAREVVAPGTPGLAEIVETFGEGVLRADGSLDRAALGQRVFEAPKARARLEAITHPRIAQRFDEERRRAQRDGVPVLVYEAALLVETGAHRAVQELVVVTADPAVQIRRVRERDGLEETAARRRLDAQAPLEQKVAAADHVINNGGSLAELERQVQALWEELIDDTESTHAAHR